jgi:hypothetical protein
VWAAVEAPDRALPALFTSQWTPHDGANTLAGVLALYGYRAAAAGVPDAARWGFTEEAAPEWVATAPEPFLVVDRRSPELGADAVVAAWREELRRRGLLARTAVVTVSVDGFAAPGSLTWTGPRAPAPLAAGALASTLDLMPTLVAAGGGTVPTDAAGSDLGVPGARRAVYQEAADGAFVVRSAKHSMRVKVPKDLPEVCPPDAELTDATGARADDPEARDALWGALRGWRARLAATTAREKMGAETFLRLNAQQGYWQ